MSRTARVTAASLTTTISAVEAEPTKSEDNSVERLLLNVDTSNRAEATLIRNTVRELHRVAMESEDSNARERIKELLLIAFKRRNHKKSMAEGEGSGEKRIFLEVLLAVIELNSYNDLVEAVLPLIPLYGCWKDLATLAEHILMRDIRTADMGSEDLHPLAQAVCRLFASQMTSDHRQTDRTPSNASKYCPHKSRHRKKRRGAPAPSSESEEEEEEEEEREREREREDRRERRGRTPRDEETTRALENLRRANARLASTIAHLACPPTSPQPRGVSAAFRRLRAGLNGRLATAGHLIEPLLCQRRAADIRFPRANKGALNKYRRAINADASAAAAWRAAMQRSAAAVPDMDSLLAAAQAFLDAEESDDVAALGATTAEDNAATQRASARVLFAAQMHKAVSSLAEAQRTLRDKSRALLIAGGATAEEADEKLHSVCTPVVLVVDTAHCEDRTQRLALFLAGVLLAQAAARDGGEGAALVLDGHVVDVSTATPENWDRLCVSSPARWQDAVTRLHTAVDAALALAARRGAGQADVLLLCQSFAAYDADADAVLRLLAERQQPPSALPPPSPTPAAVLRTLRVHRIRHHATHEGADAVHFSPRPRATPLRAEDTTADLLFMVDFTGSMGAYMDAVRAQLLSLVSELRTSTRLRHVRVGLVGYRDYGDDGRVVCEPFRDYSNLEPLLERIRDEHANGGGDSPEDLLSGLVAADTLDWLGDVCVMVVVTDADAHGFASSGDRFPSGRCPDQTMPGYPSLTQALRTLATVHQVDTLFCQLNHGTVCTQRALHSVYVDHCGGRGFGTISLQTLGVSSFRAQVLASVSNAVLGTLAEKDIAGLHTADGVTVSSLSTSWLASLRESLAGIAAEETAAEETAATSTGPESDWQRLQRECLLEELQPVRMALGMALPEHVGSLSKRAAAVLYKAGLTVQTLQANHYPDPIVDTFRAYVSEMLAHV